MKNDKWLLMINDGNTPNMRDKQFWRKRTIELIRALVTDCEHWDMLKSDASLSVKLSGLDAIRLVYINRVQSEFNGRALIRAEHCVERVVRDYSKKINSTRP